DLPRRAEAVCLVEPHRPTEVPRRVQADPAAPGAAELGFGGREQFLRDTAPLPVRADRHPPEATFPPADDCTRHRPDDVAAWSCREEYGHRGEAVSDGRRREHRVLKGGRRVQPPVRLEGRTQTVQDRGGVLKCGPADGERGRYAHGWSLLAHSSRVIRYT